MNWSLFAGFLGHHLYSDPDTRTCGDTRDLDRGNEGCTVVSVMLAALSDSCWAIASGMGRVWFMKPARAKLLGRASGLTLMGGGLWLSLARRPA
jgi:hypothetical protein